MIVKRNIRGAGLVAGMAAVALLAGCTNYVKKEDYQATVSKLEQLQQSHQQLQQQVDGLAAEVKQAFAKYDARLTQLEGRIRVDNVAYFDFNKAELKDEYKPMLDDFAKIMQAHHAQALVTVEGFADPAGSRSYNKRLGEERAEAVRNYLVSVAGMSADQVRAVSYGEDSNRQIDAGKTREQGAHNRRAALVVDFAG